MLISFLTAAFLIFAFSGTGLILYAVTEKVMDIPKKGIKTILLSLFTLGTMFALGVSLAEDALANLSGILSVAALMVGVFLALAARTFLEKKSVQGE